MKIRIRYCYSTQAKHSTIYLQIGYIAIMLGAGRWFKGKQLRVELFSHYNKFKLGVR